MKIPTTKLLTAAAVIIIAVLSGINYWPSIKNKFNYNHQPVEHFNRNVPKNSINAYPDEDPADRDKEKEQTR